MNRFVVISGCSGGGKSTLLAALQARGYRTVEEPGRRIVEDETARGGTALPWEDSVAFARRAIAMAQEDLERASGWQGWVFFDRGLVDAASYLQTLTGEEALSRWCSTKDYYGQVFLTPPWPEIYAQDDARRHDLDMAVAEYERLLQDYPALGYETVLLPKDSIAARAEFILASLVLEA
ncbi:AAA family ATPase [Methyloligella solikamskensis]|uniref:AAA family ATPase n=1 Tax=Methyloligella solikamskensis TaxID=1177756 RepID=A0ABW3JAW3_9HYPH